MHVGYVGVKAHGQSRKTLRLELPSRRPRGRAKRFMDIMKEDMKSAGVGEEDAKETDRWRHSIGSGEP